MYVYINNCVHFLELCAEGYVLLRNVLDKKIVQDCKAVVTNSLARDFEVCVCVCLYIYIYTGIYIFFPQSAKMFFSRNYVMLLCGLAVGFEN